MLKRPYLEVGRGNQVELENYIDAINDSKGTYKDGILKLYNSWLNRFITNDNSINEYYGIG